MRFYTLRTFSTIVFLLSGVTALNPPDRVPVGEGTVRAQEPSTSTRACNMNRVTRKNRWPVSLEIAKPRAIHRLREQLYISIFDDSSLLVAKLDEICWRLIVFSSLSSSCYLKWIQSQYWLQNYKNNIQKDNASFARI